jgi:hypothetical protein
MASQPPVPPYSNPDGRKAAVDFTSTFPPGTVGHVVHHSIKPFATIFGDFASGSIGAHYRQRKDALGQPATGKNIKEFAETETGYWNEQTGLPGIVGSSMGAQTRENMLNCKKSQLMKSGEWTDNP